MLNMLMAVLISLFTGTGMAFFLDYLDNTVKTPLDVAVKLGLPVLGMIPVHKALGRPKTKRRFIGAGNGRGGNGQAGNDNDLPPTYHISNRLPNSLRSPAEGLFGRVLIVESVTMGEGKTTVISQIASNLTEAGLRVLLVDCDFQRPSLVKLFKITRNGGLGKSIDRIMSHQLSSGTLSNYSMGDLFFLLALKKKSGRLVVTNEDQELIAYFHNGVLVHIQNPASPENNRIGTMLRNGGFITDEQLNDALQRHRRTGQPMGYILVNAGYIGRDKLKGPLRLQIEEYVQKMFSWKRGQFVFKPGMTTIYENERIFFEEDYAPMINNLERIEPSKFIEKELFENIHSLKQENLYLLPAGTSYKLIGALNQVLMKKIFEKLKQHFDVLLVDTPPLDAASGIESIFPLADGMVMVVKAGHLSIKTVNGALNHLPQEKIIGTILNQVKMPPNSYY
jgi:Mrp family chromosome partitioning ATPase